jgi:protein SCO1/2
MDTGHRMLRVAKDNDVLRRHFELGVNFIESLVNRHRIEVYILDAKGRIATSFLRIHWDEEQVVARTVEMLKEKKSVAAAFKRNVSIDRCPGTRNSHGTGRVRSHGYPRQ